MNEPHTPKEFATLLGVEERWVRERLSVLPGVIEESREVVFIVPSEWMSKRLAKGKR